MNRERLLKQLRVDEGTRYKPYRDTVGKLTIGVGRNLDDRGLSPDEVDYLLNNDVKLVEMELDGQLPWWRSMSDARQEVLANMCFNLGITKLLGFKNTLQFMKEGRYDAAARGMEASMWFRQVGDRARRLVKMMEEG